MRKIAGNTFVWTGSTLATVCIVCLTIGCLEVTYEILHAWGLVLGIVFMPLMQAAIPVYDFVSHRHWGLIAYWVFFGVGWGMISLGKKIKRT